MPTKQEAYGLPPAGNAPLSDGYAPKLPVGRGVDMNEGHSYTKPVGPVTGNVVASSEKLPGQRLPEGQQEFPPDNLYHGSLDRQKSLENFDIMPVYIDGPSTEVIRPVQNQNWQHPSPRWTARFAPPIFRYTREFGQRFALFNNGQHFSMARFEGVRNVKSRTMNRNSVVPRNIPQPLDDQIVDKSAQRPQSGGVFNANYSYSWK